jgi:NCS1 family nucleobase:cation symporter-1
MKDRHIDFPETEQTSVVDRLDRLYEFDREPVTRKQQCGAGYFAGSFSGEHVAATEFVIGALFVTWGARVVDVIVGLALGNLLAVLSWALVCAPIATQTRLTLYWYLRRIGGPVISVIYNVLNAILFCILAGCMITVSASAVRLPFNIPAQTLWYPTDFRFVLVVLVVGAVVVTLAILGFKRLAAFASVCAPWMLLMFLAGFLVMLPRLGEATGVGTVNSFSRFWEVGQKAVWTGRTPDGGAPLIGFWHVAAFAWICNLAMHLGLSDMALFRYAKRASYGFCSAFGMYLGHYLAWIWAGVMGAGAALALQVPLTSLDSGAVAFEALGIAGAVAVVIAGWTTSNPTLYRAGLALQAVTPNWPRWTVTLAAGAITTMIACLPFVFTRLLDFVGIYGLLLSPAGAIVITEHWLFPKLGLRRYWNENQKTALNWPALVAWAGGIGMALLLWQTGTLHLFFLFLPTFFVTCVLYLSLARWAGAKDSGEGEDQAAESTPAAADDTTPKAMDRTPKAGVGDWSLGFIAMAALMACVVMPFLVYAGDYEHYTENLTWFKKWLWLPTLVYFISATLWQLNRLKRKES